MRNLSIQKEHQKELFFPYYINQGRLLDIYAILNGGYSEYEEITTTSIVEKSKGTKGTLTGSGGFKILNIGGDLSGSYEHKGTQENDSKEKKVQTITSILSLVVHTLKNKKYVTEITKSTSGSFVVIPVSLQINSIRSLIEEIADLLKLCSDMQRFGASVKGTAQQSKDINTMLSSIKVLFDGEEVIYETPDFAIVGNIIDSNLYQASRADLIGVNLNCLAQVKRFFPMGSELMRNTIFTKIKDKSAKQKLIESVSTINSGKVFDFEATAISEIEGKPLYQLEIIALYQ